MAEAFAEVKKALCEELGVKTLRARIWKDLVHMRNVEQVANQKMTVEVLARIYRIKEEDYYPSKQEKPVRKDKRDIHAMALAQIVAETLDQLLPQREEFGEAHLGGKHLSFARMGTWIKEQAGREGAPPAGALAVPVSRDNDYLPTHSSDARAYYHEWLARELARLEDDPACELPPRRRLEPLTLTFMDERQRLARIAIRGDGMLAELKALAGVILDFHTGWDEAGAVTYILTEEIPYIPTGRRSVRLGLLPATSRIFLEINPRLSPSVVAAYYAAARRRFIKGRARPLDDKHLALAVFAQRHAALHEGSWTEWRERWNDAYAKWRYDPDRDPYAIEFASEARTAWMRVTGSQWPDLRKTRAALRRLRKKAADVVPTSET